MTERGKEPCLFAPDLDRMKKALSVESEALTETTAHADNPLGVAEIVDAEAQGASQVELMKDPPLAEKLKFKNLAEAKIKTWSTKSDEKKSRSI